MLDNSQYIEKLRSSGLRPTKQRIKICEVLFNSEKTFHFTINELVKRISKSTNDKISLATVYNTVHAFKNKGYLKRYQLILIKVILIPIRRITTISMMRPKKI